MKVRWHGHSCFEVDGKVKIVMDPHDGKSIGLKVPKASPDIALLSHDHFDHNAVGVLGGKPVVVRGAGERVEKEVALKGVETFHDDVGGQKRGRNVAFSFEMDGVRFAHLGDLGHVLTDEQTSMLGKVDVLFVPVGGVFTVDSMKALAVVNKVQPKVIVPMHFRFGGLTLGISPVSDFTKLLPKAVKVREVGSEVEFAAEDLPEKQECWLFSL